MTAFALTFGAPGLLAGLGLAAVPLVIHLLNKQRFRRMDWAAMRWLLAAMRRNQRRIRIEQWLLLALRTLIILLVVAAMAKPFLDAAGLPLVADTTVTHNVLVFDNTMSMQYSLTDRSRWDRAKGFAQAILDGCQQGDLASVVVMGTPTGVLVGDPSPYLVAVSEEIDAIKPQHVAGRVEPAIDKVAEILKGSPAVRKRVFLITDMQRSAWLGSGSEEQSADLPRKLKAISEQAGFTILDVSGADSPNVAVVGFEQAEPVVVRGRPALLRATVANFSDVAREAARVEFLVDGQVESVETVSLPPNERVTVPFAFAFRDAGDRVVEARLSEDPLRPDNHRWKVVKVRSHLSALLVDGQPSGEPFESETDYLEIALAPGDADGASLVHAEKRLESDLFETRLDDYDLVVLCNVGQLTEGEASLLTDYLKRGGGVVFFLGPQVDVQAYNQVLFKEGKGIVPVRLIGTEEKAAPDTEFFRFDPLGYAHPVVKAFEKQEQSGLLSTKIFTYVKAARPDESLAEVALAYQNGDPAIVVAPVERGMVAVVTTTADLDWNTWAISPSYLPVVQELTRQVVAGRVREDEALAGETISVPAPREAYDALAEVTPPGSQSSPVAVRLEERDGVNSLTYSDTSLSGIYRARIGSPINREWPLAVNAWPEESDLRKLVADDLRALAPGWEFTLLDEWRYDEARSTAGVQNRQDLHRPLLYLALALLFVETYLAWKFGHHHA